MVQEDRPLGVKRVSAAGLAGLTAQERRSRTPNPTMAMVIIRTLMSRSDGSANGLSGLALMPKVVRNFVQSALCMMWRPTYPYTG
jgi:hypothetical protein